MEESSASGQGKFRYSPHLSEVRIWLDSYDELFSDFDPRPYSQRIMSDDFISQMKKITNEFLGKKVTLKLLIPENIRKKEDETTINKRIHYFFLNSWDLFREEKRSTRRRGGLLAASGIILMIAGSLVSYYSGGRNYYSHLLLILFEPAGWFLFWTGLDDLVTFSRKRRNDSRFFSTMKNAKIEFESY